MRIVPLLAFALMVLPVDVEGHILGDSNDFKPRASGVMLQIDYGNGTTVVYDEVAGSNVLEVTESVALVQAEWTGDLAFVYSINGVSSKEETGLWWQYWVNGEFASIAANLRVVQDNDTIAWRFTDSQVEQPTTTQPDDPGQFGPLFIASAGLGSIGIGFLLALHLIRRRN